MTRRESLGVQFNTVLSKRVRQTVYKKTLSIMKDTCQKVVLSFVENGKFFNVTGNTATSFTAGVFYKGKLVFKLSGYDILKIPPTRKTLKKGEEYDLPFYYDGITPNAAGRKTFVGIFGHGGQWGPSLGPNRLSRMHSRVRDTWNIIAVCPVEYAKYNEKIFKALYETYEMFPDLFSADVIYARSQGFNSM